MADIAFSSYVARIAMLAPAFLVAISFHECAHAYVAHLFGDDTAERLGRLTINPMRHLDIVGTFCLLVFGIGWAQPVPFDERNFRYPRLCSVLVALAGPVANLIMALLFLYAIKGAAALNLSPHLAMSVRQVFDTVVYVNIMLAVFNVMPVPPLDGSHLIRVMLPAGWQRVMSTLSLYSILFWLLILSLPAAQRLFLYAIMYVRMFLQHLVI